MKKLTGAALKSFDNRKANNRTVRVFPNDSIEFLMNDGTTRHFKFTGEMVDVTGVVPEIQEIYDVIRVGDVVKVLDDSEWSQWGSPEMDNLVGDSFQVSFIDSDGDCYSDDFGFYFRPSHLVKVK